MRTPTRYRWPVAVIALAVVIGTASVAVADDNVTPDGTEDAVFSVSAVAFGSVCPDRDVTHGLQVGLKTQGRTRPNTYGNSTQVTFSVRTQILGTPSNGWFEGPAGSFGAATLPPTPGVDAGSITTPSDWQTRGTAAAPCRRRRAPSSRRSTPCTFRPMPTPGAYQGTGVGSRGEQAGTAPTPSTSNLILPTPSRSEPGGPLLGTPHNVNWTVLDGDDAGCNRAPSVLSASFGAQSHVACGAASLDVRVDDPEFGIASADHETLTIDVDFDGDGTTDATRTGVTSSAVQTFAAPYDAGQHTAHVTVTDQHGATDTDQASMTVDYGTSGILQPVNATGPISIFKAGSTVPLKVRFTNCAGGRRAICSPRSAWRRSPATRPPRGPRRRRSTRAPNRRCHALLGRAVDLQPVDEVAMSDPSATYRLSITVPGPARRAGRLRAPRLKIEQGATPRAGLTPGSRHPAGREGGQQDATTHGDDDDDPHDRGGSGRRGDAGVGRRHHDRLRRQRRRDLVRAPERHGAPQPHERSGVRP